MDFSNLSISKNLIDAFQTLAVIFPLTLITYMITYVRLWNLRRHLKLFFIEFLLYVMPTLFNLTVFAQSIYQLVAFVVIVALSFYVTFYCSHFSRGKKRKINTMFNSQHYTFITNARALVNLVTAIAILAIDFNVFPKDFGKTKKYGFSLMDAGVGLFVYANSLVVSKREESFLKILRDSVILFALGIGRYFVTTEIKYHVAVWEYGVHWNFFITLAITRVLGSLLIKLIGDRFLFVVGPLLLACHETLLQYHLAEFVFGPGDRKLSFIVANREGIVSSLGYVALYLFSVPVGHLLKHQYKAKRTGVIKVIALLVALLIATVVLNYFFQTSRTLANSSYCCWALFIGVFMTEMYYFCECLHKSITKCKYVPPTFLNEAINYNGLAFFLICNVLTGFVNIIFNTKKIPTFESLVILTVYLFVCCSAIVVLYVKKLRLKL